MNAKEPLPGVDKQVHQMAKSQIEVLDAAGLKLEDIVSGHVYLADMRRVQRDERDLSGVFFQRAGRSYHA